MRVKIYTPAKSATQSGRGRAKGVVLEPAELGARAPEPLMGWTAAADTLNQIHLTFATVEQAVAHARAQGWEVEVAPPAIRQVRPRNYVDNFKYLPPDDQKKA